MRMIKAKFSQWFESLYNLSLTYILLIGFIFFLLWASFFQLDQTIVASGQVISEAKTQVIQAADGGILTSLYVQEGQSVKAGEVLAVLQQDSANAGYQTALAELESNREILASVQDELRLNQSLLKTGDVGYLEVAHLQRQMVELRGKVRMGEQKLAQQKISLDRTELISPLVGVVKLLKINTIGGVLRPGEEIMQIAPSSKNLVIEVRVNPIDIGFLKEGLQATVKLDAYDYSIFGTLHGIVTYISPDTLVEQGANGQSAVYYRAHIEIPADELKKLESRNIQLKLGMSATADIRTGSRSVLSYILKPLHKGFGGALHER